MGWLEGLLTGYVDRHHEIEKQKMDEAVAANQREGQIFQALLSSPDENVRQMAGVGMLDMANPLRKTKGFRGFLGEVDRSPMLPLIRKYMKTPQPYDVETAPAGLPSTQHTGYQLPPGQDPAEGRSRVSAALPAESPTEAGTPPITPPVPTPPPSPPPAPPGAARIDPSVAPGTTILTNPPIQGPPVPPGQVNRDPGLLREPPPGMTNPDPGIFREPPPPPPSAAAAPPSPPRFSEEVNVTGTPPPSPPMSFTRQVPGAPAQTETRTRYPRGFPTAADLDQQKIEGEVRTFQQLYKERGDPDWQQRGIDAALAQHTRGGLPYKVVNVEYTGPDGRPVEDLGVFDAARGRFYSQDGVTPLPPDARPVVKTGGGTGALQPIDRAAVALGYRNAREVPPERQADLSAKMAETLRNDAAGRAGGTAAGKYQEELKRVNPADVQRVAWEAAHDWSKASLMNGHSQAFKDQVLSAMVQSGTPIEKLSEATRQMAETAKDILPVMQKIDDDAKAFDRLGMMGPIAGRWQDFVTGKIGSAELGAPTPEAAVLASTFRTEVDLLQKAVLRAHAGARGAGSPEGLEKIEGMLSAAHMDLNTFHGALEGFKVWMDQYAKHLPDWGTRGVEPDPNAPPVPPPPEPPPLSPDDHLKAMVQKYGAGAAPAPGTINRDSAIVAGPDGKLIIR